MSERERGAGAGAAGAEASAANRGAPESARGASPERPASARAGSVARDGASGLEATEGGGGAPQDGAIGLEATEADDAAGPEAVERDEVAGQDGAAALETAERAARAGRPLRSGQDLPRGTTRFVPTPVQAITALALAAAVFAAPFLADDALARFGTRTVSAAALGFALAVLALRYLASREPLRLLREALGPIALLGMAWATSEARWLLFVPALVNATLAVVFARSALSSDPAVIPIVERGARLMQSYLPDFTANYCRILTLFWALWFGVFALAIVWAAVAVDRSVWRFISTTLYFGGIAAVSAIEFVHRKLWFRNYGPGPLDQLFQRFFPCEATWRGRRSKEYLTHIHRTLYGHSRFD